MGDCPQGLIAGMVEARGDPLSRLLDSVMSNGWAGRNGSKKKPKPKDSKTNESWPLAALP